jgi:hypothetical protein
MKHLLATLLLFTSAAHSQQLGITAETWTGLTPGKSILILQKEGISTRVPNTIQTLQEAKITGLPANSGTRLRGTLTPTVDDNFTFWVNGTDNVALWISEDGTRFSKRLVAHHFGATTNTEWGKFSTQKSQPIPLTAGVTYHIEAHVMTSVANGHLSVSWQGSKGNWALAANGATATQSSTQWALNASNAINGDTGSIWNQASLTSNLQNSWLRVNFDQARPLNKIVLFNISQNQNRLSNFRLTAHDATGAVLAQQDFFTTSGNVGNSFTWDMPTTVQAASIRIQLLGNNLAGNGHLSLAEIQAYGPGPYETTRNQQIIPAAFLRPISSEPGDTNDNHLLDIWEQQTGLASSVLPGSLLELGDPDNDGLTNYEENLYGSNPLVTELMADGLIRSMWTDEATSSNVWSFVRNRPRFLNYPSETKFLPNIDDRPTYANAGYRYRGYITAPTTGIYRFWIAGTNDSELWLSDGTVKHPTTGAPLTNRFGKQRLAAGGYVTPLRDYDYHPNQRSRAIHLTAGQTYYIEVIHKIAQGSNHHISVAWQPPGQLRAIIPSTAYTANAPDPLDAEDDNLPDAWETSKGLNPANNGRTNSADGEYGDPDNDTLTNLVEFQLGTHPGRADTDGDGYSDSDEVNLYRSDPLAPHSFSSTLHSTANLHQPADTSFPWEKNSDGTITAHERLGWIDLPVNVAPGGQGIHEIRLVASVSPSALTVPLSFHIDGKKIARANHALKTTPNTTAPIKVITPFLPAGAHILRVQNHNPRAGFRLRIHSLTLHHLGGADTNADGIADWAEARFSAGNRLTALPTESLTSPAYIEGVTALPSALRLSAGVAGSQPATVSPQYGCNGIFYAHIPLDPSETTDLGVSFRADEATHTHPITWAPTNLLAHSSLTIAKGDSLRLTAHGGINPEGTFILTGSAGFQPVSSSSTAPLIHTFDQPGVHTLTATWTPPAGDPVTSTLILTVRSADFGSPIYLQTYNPRTWSLPGLRGMAVEADAALFWRETTAAGAASRSFHVEAYEAEDYRAIARCPDTSRILAAGTVSAFSLYNAKQTIDAQIVEVRPDGSKVLRFSIVGENLPAHLAIRFELKYQGVTLPDGSRTLTLRPRDFSSSGVADILVETTSDPRLCHSMQALLID